MKLGVFSPVKLNYTTNVELKIDINNNIMTLHTRVVALDCCNGVDMVFCDGEEEEKSNKPFFQLLFKEKKAPKGTKMPAMSRDLFQIFLDAFL